MQKDRKIIGLYIRVSTGKQVQEGYSIEGQEEEGTQLAYRLFGNDIVIETYIDEGISAKSTKGRKELNRMMKDVKQGLLDAIITYKVSRLSRSLSDSLKLVEEIDKSKVKFISIKEGEYGKAHTNLQFNILASVAQYQREELAENVQMGMTQRAREGKWNGGQVLGYETVDKELVIVPHEAEVIKIIFDKYVHEGWGTKKIANYLNTIGKRTKKNKTFSITSVSIILDNPVYKGYVRYNQVINWESNRRKGKNPDYILSKGNHKEIIDEETWNKASELRKKRSTGTPRQYSGTFPLTSLLKCPECGAYMTSLYGAKRKDGTKKRYYACGMYHNKGRAECNPNLIDADWIEEAVFERLQKAMLSESVINEITQKINNQIKQHPSFNEQTKEIQLLQKRLDDLEARKKRIQDLVETEVYTADEAKKRMEEVRSEINDTKNTLHATLDKQSSTTTTIKPVTPDFIRKQLQEFLDLKEQLTVMEFRQLLVASIEKIEASKKELKNIFFSFIANLPDDDLDPTDPGLHKNTKTTPLIIRGLHFKQNHYLFMIRFTLTVLTAKKIFKVLTIILQKLPSFNVTLLINTSERKL